MAFICGGCKKEISVEKVEMRTSFRPDGKGNEEIVYTCFELKNEWERCEKETVLGTKRRFSEIILERASS